MKKLLCSTVLLLIFSLFLIACAEEYGLGETWTVDSQWTLTVDSIEEIADRNEYFDKKPAAVYIVTYTYANTGYVDPSGIWDGLFIGIDDTIVDCDGMMGYSYPASIDYSAQEVPVGAKCKAQAAIGVDTAGLPIKLYVDVNDGNGEKQSAVFVLGEAAEQSSTVESSTSETTDLPTESDEDISFLDSENEMLTITDIIPDDGIWGISEDAFQQAYPASYTSTNVGKTKALVQEGLTIEGYHMNGYYVFAEDGLSRIVYILVDNSDKAMNKKCFADLSSAMVEAIGRAGVEGKGVVEWDNPTIQVGTGKMQKYTGKDGLSACIIFKGSKKSSDKQDFKSEEQSKKHSDVLSDFSKSDVLLLNEEIRTNPPDFTHTIDVFYVAELKNNTDEPYSVYGLSLDLEDAKGSLVLTSSSISVYPDVIMPGSSGFIHEKISGFAGDEDFDPKVIAKPVLHYKTKAMPGYEYPNVTVSEIIIGDEPVFRNISCRVQNNTDEDLSGLNIVGLLFDDNDKYLTYTISLFESIDPHDKKGFKLMELYKDESVDFSGAKVKIFVY